MKLNTKLLVTHVIVGIILLALASYLVSVSLEEREFNSIRQSFISQLYQVDFALTSFLVEVECDVLDLMVNDIVRTRKDREFTNFLDADEATFEYDIGETEQAIIDIFDSYRLNHPYANSVYMGRENGSFVRSHPRARPTKYDPRQRPWYQIGFRNPDKVMRTAPYRSVTTPDVNVGTVKALIDEQGQTYGVVGIDITLRNLTDFLSNISVGQDSYIVLLDDLGIVLTGPDEELRFQRYYKVGLDHFQAVMDGTEGYTTFEQGGEEHYLFYYTSPALGWKVVAVVPMQIVDQQVRQTVNQVLLLLAITLVLLSALTAIGVRQFIVRPIKKLQQSTETIIETGNLDHRISVGSKGEIGQLGASFNKMVGSIRTAGQELRESEEKYRGLVENISIGVFRSTADGQLLHANTAAVQILGYDSINKAAIYPPDLYSEPDQRQQMIQWLEEGKAIKDLELQLLKKDGSPIWVSLSVTGQYDDDGSLEWLDGAFEDITARRETDDALRRARDELELRVAERTADLEARNAELDAFAHTVAHDLKSPISVIVGYAEVLEEQRNVMSNDLLHKYLSSIAQHGRKMSTIVDELLLLSSVREMEEIETYPLDMGAIVDEACQRLCDLTEELEGEIILPETWPIAMGYAPWVEEIWLNYISNALKYGGRPPRVELGACILEPEAPSQVPFPHDNMSQPGMLCFWIRDNGLGLSIDEQASLFAPFERFHQVRVEGHGLGLSIVRRIITRLGGQVGVHSDGVPGQGCTFSFALPAASDGDTLF